MHLAPPVCLLLQEGIQFSKGCARSRDAGWVGAGLMGRRQVGSKDMWEWTHGFLPGRSCEKRKNNNIDKEDKQIKLTKRNVVNVRKVLYKHSGCGWGVMSPEKNTQEVWWEGGDSESLRTSASQAWQLGMPTRTEGETAMLCLSWSWSKGGKDPNYNILKIKMKMCGLTAQQRSKYLWYSKWLRTGLFPLKQSSFLTLGFIKTSPLMRYRCSSFLVLLPTFLSHFK